MSNVAIKVQNVSKVYMLNDDVSFEIKKGYLINSLSKELNLAFPLMKGFSVRNLNYMRQFCFYLCR